MSKVVVRNATDGPPTKKVHFNPLQRERPDMTARVDGCVCDKCLQIIDALLRCRAADPSGAAPAEGGASGGPAGLCPADGIHARARPLEAGVEEPDKMS